MFMGSEKPWFFRKWKTEEAFHRKTEKKNTQHRSSICIQNFPHKQDFLVREEEEIKVRIIRAKISVGTRKIELVHCYLGQSLGRWQKCQVTLWDLRAERM